VNSTYLKKTCIDFDIPIPKNGYWSKLQHGKKVEKPLLKGDINIVIELNLVKEAKNKVILKVPKRLIKPDKLVTIAKKDLASKNISHRYKAKGMVTTSKEVIDITVTQKLVSRALIFMDIFIKLARKRGFTIWFKGYYGTVISIHGIDAPIYLREKNKRVIVRDNGHWKETELVPIGELVFKKDNYPRREWQDSKTKLLENKIPAILDYLEEQAIQEKAEEIQRKKRREVQRQKQKIEDELKQLRKNEIEKFNIFYEDSNRYQKAEQLRNFIDAKRVYAIKTNTLDESLVNWIKWANGKADWLDPLISYEDLILGDYESFK
tara:strand:+ start:14803 stop:15765 length:963 start_codon:yes stop_codon:yes gene_type:complete